MIDNNRRRAPTNVVIQTAFQNNMKEVYTGIPGHVLAFDSTTQRAQIQIGIIRVNIDGTTFNVPPIVDVPVQFPGDDFVLEYQINPGCEGYIHFSQRCLDGWKQTGGIADNPVARFHNKQDAFFSPGGRSLGNAIATFSNDGIRIRDNTGDRHMWIKGDGSMVVKNGQSTTTYGADNSIIMTNGGGTINIMANGNVVINGVVFTPTGTMTPPAGGGITGANGIAYETHRHNETGTITGTPRT